eukprot:CAMPEP_0204825736 /NCGR_PEP_ID=MMETSP1346-20131115/3551_1 /ASSEMBLY_ACC=CAM_ASM_000771 /TAXON_ID=215587 /ORGANISM="Aplanochytrium stocchinoi, Strain GSBS06" /LENGTH=331 /DNA_ID=CAMNT_0051953453 /DNA_START=61 /DNA_END=1056 /DNA_ORIENTATION=+
MVLCDDSEYLVLSTDGTVTLCNFGIDDFDVGTNDASKSSLSNPKHVSIHVLLLLWWLCLTLCSLYYLRASYGINYYSPIHAEGVETKDARTLRYCSNLYIVVCAIRAVWLRRDVERICFFDTWISYPIVGRTLATVAELCFSNQIGMALAKIAEQVKCFRIQAATRFVVPSIVIAQSCCWMGVTTQLQLWHGLEETIWMVVMQLCGLGALLCATQIKAELGYSGSGANRLRIQLLAAFVFSILFSAFMATVDVPMYLNRYNEDEAKNITYFSPAEGLIDSASCKQISKTWEDWESEIPWVTGYFVIAPYLSLCLISIPDLKKRKIETKKRN